MENKKGFTLAEVLITLAIIGVVAALTIPTVVKNYQKTQTITKLKKAYSTLSQAYNNSQAENGMYQTWDKGEDIGPTEYFDRYWKSYLKVQKICTSYSDCGYKSNMPWKSPVGTTFEMNVVYPSFRVTFLTSDGLLFVIFTQSGAEVVSNTNIYVDLNGSKEPNQLGKDLFMFVRTDKGVLPRCYSDTMDTINNNCSKTGQGFCCAAKLARDGWEIKDSYPW